MLPQRQRHSSSIVVAALEEQLLSPAVSAIMTPQADGIAMLCR